MIDLELPEDYEPCADCLFDHEYDREEAERWHALYLLMLSEEPYQEPTS
jgi:hypothetical protein